MAENTNETALKEPEIQAETEEKPKPVKKSGAKVDAYGREILPIEELDQREEEYSEKEYEELRGLYEDTLSEIEEGETVVGRILEITSKEVKVDIGFKSEGVIPADEFTNLAELSEGDEVDVFLENVEDKDGQLVLSRKKADFMKLWEKIIHVYESGETIEGTIVRRIKGGMVVNVQGVDAFLPGSQIDVKPIRDFDAYVGKTRDFKIVKLNDARKNIVTQWRQRL